MLGKFTQLITFIGGLQAISGVLVPIIKALKKIFEYTNGNKKCLVKKRDNNILFNRQYNILLVELDNM